MVFALLKNISLNIRLDHLIGYVNLIGSLETGIYFLVYERLKSSFANGDHSYSLSFMDYLIAASVAKLMAVWLCYPHEVIRTRLRQDNVLGKRQ